MTEHVHEWVFDIMPMEIRCLDGACDKRMPLEEGERRINATERLSSDAALAAFVHMPEEQIETIGKQLRDYALALI